jgi:hypothetical protein
VWLSGRKDVAAPVVVDLLARGALTSTPAPMATFSPKLLWSALEIVLAAGIQASRVRSARSKLFQGLAGRRELTSDIRRALEALLQSSIDGKACDRALGHGPACLLSLGRHPPPTIPSSRLGPQVSLWLLHLVIISALRF